LNIFRTNRQAIVVLFGLILTFAANQVMAADKSMRCGTHLIHAGGGKDSALMYEVLRKCGEPVAKQGNDWIYSQGGKQKLLTFNLEGRLQRIESRR